MKKTTHKKLLTGVGIALGAIFLSSCTANFCSSTDQASMAYPYDQGVTVYVTKEEYDALKNGNDATAEVIKQEETWSTEAAKYGLPAIAGKALDGNDKIYKYIPFSYKTKTENDTTTIVKSSDGSLIFQSFTSDKAGSLLNSIISSASSNGYYIPSVYYFGLLDDYALKAAIVESDETGGGWGTYVAEASTSATDLKDWNTYSASTDGKNFISALSVNGEDSAKWAVNAYKTENGKETKELIQNGKAEDGQTRSVLYENGRIKFSGILYNDNRGDETRDLWGYYDTWNTQIRVASEKTLDGKAFSQLDVYALPSTDFITLYKSNVSSKVSGIRSCIATRDGYYGHYGSNSDWKVPMQKKTWAYAWHKGFLEGLLVYPVSWLTDTFAIGMDPALSGVGQIFAIIFVTLIVRGLLLLVSFRSTMDSQKMQAMQPELAKIQAKYPNANTNQAEKQRLSQEQMALYRRHGVKPFRQMLVLIIQFPVFICVWSGLQGSSALATGEFLNLSLSDTIQSVFMNFSGTWYLNTTGWWTAVVLFILMAGVQILAMLLPKIITKIQNRNMPKLNVNNTQNQQNKTMKYVSIAMMAFTIIMGFMLPSAMGVYWLIGGLMSMIQTGITQLVLAKNKKRKK